MLLISADLTLGQRRTVRHHRHGHVVKTLPRGHAKVVVRGVTYHSRGGVFHRPQATGWLVVAPPMGAVLTALPPGARLVRVKGVRDHLHNGVHYRPMIRNGVSVYVVARL
tara:strand:- start:659 stop:988 length:330 start_codon:yes stop_codon:yes gene_type:complete